MENEVINQDKKKNYELFLPIIIILLVAIFVIMALLAIIQYKVKTLDAFVGTYYTADKKYGIELTTDGNYYILPKSEKNKIVVYDGVKFEVRVTGTYKSSKDEIVFTQEYKEVVPFNENIAKAEELRRNNPMAKSSPRPEIGTVKNQRVQRDTAIYKDGKIYFNNGTVYIKENQSK